jgi:hypothetical protein
MTEVKKRQSTLRTSPKLRAKIVSVTELSLADEARMFQLMQAYYDDVRREQFLADLSQKSRVILLFDKNNQQIQGFSTLLCLRHI